MADLSQAIETVRSRISQYQGKGINEQNTKATLIQPILRALGWDVEDLEDVQLEYKRRPSDKPVDYALLLLRQPCLFVEAKALGQNLDDRKWASQILGYASVAGVEWVAITNGDEYRLYNSHAPVPVEDKLFRTARISDDNSKAEETLSLLSKERIRENEIDILWKADYIDRRVGAALHELLATNPDPDPAIIRLLSKRISTLEPRDIRASMQRAQVRIDFPVEPSKGQRPSRPDKPSLARKRLKKVRPPATVRKAKSKAFAGVSLADLIKAELLAVPVKIYKRYRGTNFEATIQIDGTVEFNGVTFTSTSSAADEARRTIIGGTPHTNGWEWWGFKDASGKLVSLDTIRQQFLQSRKPKEG